MRRYLLTAGIVLLFLTGSGQSMQDRPKKLPDNDTLLLRLLADEVLTNSTAYENLKVLTKQVGSRLSGSAGYYRAEAWGQAALRAAGADNVRLQECMVPHWVRGGKDNASYTIGGEKTSLNVLALGNSLGTPPAGLSAPVIMIRSFDELEQHKDEVRGKIVFYNYPFNQKFVETFRAYGDAVGYRVFGASKAAKYGAIGVLVRSMSESVDNDPHTGAMFYNDSFPKIPAAAIGLQDAARLAAQYENKGSRTITGFIRTYGRMLPDTLAHNVIGELRGTEHPEQVIVVGGHLDSWDPAEGAHDDGAGCVHAIEILRALKAIGYQPKHTIRVVLFANEENGGRGGEKYADAAIEAKEQHILALESDAGGFTPRSIRLSYPVASTAKVQSWVPLLKPYGVYQIEQGGGGADVTPIGARTGIVVGELIPDSQRYFDIHHAAGDVLENVNKRELELGALNMAALIYLVDKYGF